MELINMQEMDSHITDLCYVSEKVEMNEYCKNILSDAINYMKNIKEDAEDAVGIDDYESLGSEMQFLAMYLKEKLNLTDDDIAEISLTGMLENEDQKLWNRNEEEYGMCVHCLEMDTDLVEVSGVYGTCERCEGDKDE